MNGDKPKFGNVTIGTDPSLLEKVDVIEEVPTQKETKLETEEIKKEEIDSLDVEILDNNELNNNNIDNNKNKKNNNKNIILIIVIAFVLIIGVGAGLFFYLRIGTNSVKNNQNNNVTLNETNDDTRISVKSITVLKDSELSSSLADYIVNNETSSVSCSLDTSTVNINEVGNYSYTVTCNNKSYVGIVNVINTDMLKYSNDLVLKNINEELIAGDFVVSSNSSFNFENNINKVTNSLNVVPLKETMNELNNTMTVHSAYILYEDTPEIVLDCQIEKESYTLIDKFVFNADNEDLKTPLRIYKYFFEDEYYYNYVSKIDENGYLELNSVYGYALVDNYQKSISIVTENNYNNLQEEYNGDFPSDYGSIKNYYENNSYICND